MTPSKKIVDFKCQCGRCNQWLVTAEFYRDKTKVTGLASYCKKCDRQHRKNRGDILPDGHASLFEIKRKCNVCNREKFLAEFGIDKEIKYGRTRKCKECRVKLESRRQSEYLYGVTFEQKQAILLQQMGICANRACGKDVKFDTNLRKEMAVLDHCHATGKIRGILCNRCNMVLGMVERKFKLKSKNMAFGLMEYLQKHST